MSKYILQIYRNIKKQTNLCHLGWYQKVNFRGLAHGLSDTLPITGWHGTESVVYVRVLV